LDHRRSQASTDNRLAWFRGAAVACNAPTSAVRVQWPVSAWPGTPDFTLHLIRANNPAARADAAGCEQARPKKCVEGERSMRATAFGTGPLSPAARRTIIAGCIGFAVDFFDIYLPILAMAPVIGYFEPKGLSPAATTTIYFFTFAATLLGRPCGAVIFGHWADRIGRRRTTMIAIVGFGALTFLIGCLPGYEAIGLWSLALLLLLRFVDGVFMGGEYTSNNTLALEMVPRDRRGLVGGILQGAYPIGFFLVSVVTLFMLEITTKQQYYDWGWRIPFFIGALLAFLFLIYYRRVPESQLWQEAEKSEAPLKDLLVQPHLGNLLQIMIMMLGFWFAAQSVIGVMPGILIQQLHISSRAVTGGLLITSFLQFFAYVGVGLLSQLIGRRRAIVLSGIVVLVGGSGLYAAAVALGLAGGPPLLTVALACLCYMLVVSPWGVVTTYLVERFPTHVRASGYGIGYSLAVVVPAFAGFYMLGLAMFMPYEYTPVVLLLIAGVLMVVGALMGPETRDVELHLIDVAPAPRLAGQALGE
jgi:MFS family permease